MKVYKITLCFVDHDGLGDQQTQQLFNTLRLPNHICKPDVMEMESVDIGEWEDSNPLNSYRTIGAEFRRLFPERDRPMTCLNYDCQMGPDCEGECTARSAQLCEHSNEVPTSACTCPGNCYCRVKGTCRHGVTKTPDLLDRAGTLAREVGVLEVLLQQAKNMPPPTMRERQAQALSFAYGNLKMTSNHSPSYESFEKLARERYGWTEDEFAIFAAGRDWTRKR